MVGPAIWWLARSAVADPGSATPVPIPTEQPAPDGAPEAVPAPPEGPEGEPPAPPEPAPRDPALLTFHEVLQQAEQWYFEGRADQARDWLELLQSRALSGDEAPWEEVVEALTYLGEIQYDQGEPDAARVTFRWILERDPDAPISPYEHPQEVVVLFDLVRNTVKSDRAAEPPVVVPPSPAPAWVWLPFGLPQLAQHRRGAAVVYGGLQVALATASIATFVDLARYNQDQVPSVPDPERRPYVQLRRYAVQWPATLGFYGVWVASSVDAGVWHRRHPPLSVGLEAGDHLGVVVGGRF